MVVEGLNNKVKLVIRKSYGFRTPQVTKFALLHNVGLLTSRIAPTVSAESLFLQIHSSTLCLANSFELPVSDQACIHSCCISSEI
jgi:hypothetical protein